MYLKVCDFDVQIHNNGCFLKICQKWLGDGLTYDIPLPPIPCVVNRDLSDSFIHPHSRVSQGKRDIFISHQITVLQKNRRNTLVWFQVSSILFQGLST